MSIRELYREADRLRRTANRWINLADERGHKTPEGKAALFAYRQTWRRLEVHPLYEALCPRYPYRSIFNVCDSIQMHSDNPARTMVKHTRVGTFQFNWLSGKYVRRESGLEVRCD